MLIETFPPPSRCMSETKKNFKKEKKKNLNKRVKERGTDRFQNDKILTTFLVLLSTFLFLFFFR